MEKDLTTIVNQAAISCGYEEQKPEQASISNLASTLFVEMMYSVAFQLGLAKVSVLCCYQCFLMLLKQEPSEKAS